MPIETEQNDVFVVLISTINYMYSKKHMSKEENINRQPEGGNE